MWNILNLNEFKITGSDDGNNNNNNIIYRLKALNTEQFTALLTPSYSDLVEPDSGGTAIISTLASPPTIHISLVFNGVFLPDEVSDVPLTVRLENSEKGHVIFEEVNNKKKIKFSSAFLSGKIKKIFFFLLRW